MAWGRHKVGCCVGIFSTLILLLSLWILMSLLRTPSIPWVFVCPWVWAWSCRRGFSKPCLESSSSIKCLLSTLLWQDTHPWGNRYFIVQLKWGESPREKGNTCNGKHKLFTVSKLIFLPIGFLILYQEHPCLCVHAACLCTYANEELCWTGQGMHNKHTYLNVNFTVTQGILY